jgi:hypothetical protein
MILKWNLGNSDARNRKKIPTRRNFGMYFSVTEDIVCSPINNHMFISNFVTLHECKLKIFML